MVVEASGNTTSCGRLDKEGGAMWIIDSRKKFWAFIAAWAAAAVLWMVASWAAIEAYMRRRDEK